MGELIVIGNTSKIGSRRQMNYTRFVRVVTGSEHKILAGTLGSCVLGGKKRRLAMVKLQNYRGGVFYEQILGLGSCIEIGMDITIWAVATIWSDNFCTPTGLILMITEARSAQ